MWDLRFWRRRQPRPTTSKVRTVEVRIAETLFGSVRRHVEDFSRGEEAGFLLCSPSRLAHGDLLIARKWIPIPDRAIRRGDGSVLSWSANFNSEVLTRALEEGATPVLVHSHGRAAPGFSGDDRAMERRLFPTFSRLLGQRPTGTLLIGEGDAVGSFWASGAPHGEFERLTVVTSSIEVWPAVGRPVAAPRTARTRLDRQTVAIGPRSDARLAAAKVGILGLSGGGSHVFQQLVHQGVGTLIAVDDDLVDETNLGRLVGATLADVDLTPKVELARRIAAGVDPSIEVEPVCERFPSAASIAALKEADVIVACLDRFDAREQINVFCRRHMIPLVDLGMTIRSSDERLEQADGQVIVTLPEGPCMRCWFLTDAVLAAERRNRPPGYDRNPDAPGDPQVVSMNGTLASEASNSVLDLITGYSGGRRGAGMWRYDGRRGALSPGPLPSRRMGCPACAEEGRGDSIRDWN